MFPGAEVAEALTDQATVTQTCEGCMWPATVTPHTNCFLLLCWSYSTLTLQNAPDEVQEHSDGQVASPGQLIGIIQQPRHILTAQHCATTATTDGHSCGQLRPYQLRVIHSVEAILTRV